MPYTLLAGHSSQFLILSFNGSEDLLLHRKIEPGVGSVAESVGRDFSHSLSLPLLISCLAPCQHLDLTNGFARDHSALQFSSVARIDQGLLIEACWLRPIDWGLLIEAYWLIEA
jgi:hypothetical protein